MTQLPPDNKEGRTDVLHGTENAVRRGSMFMSNVKNRMDISFDNKGPSIVVEVDAYRNGYVDIRKRGGKIRALTEITRDNIHHCKKLVKIVDELRHLDGIKGGIAVNETEYMATSFLEDAKPLTQVIYSNVKEMVIQGQYIFDTLWNLAIPAEEKFREFEEGIEPERTMVLHGTENILQDRERNFSKLQHQLDSVTDANGPAVIVGTETIWRDMMDAAHRDVKMRFVTEITKENLPFCKEMLPISEVRHLENLRGHLSIADGRNFVSSGRTQEGKPVSTLVKSNVRELVSQQQYFFEALWEKSIPANQRIREIEHGIERELVQTIVDPRESLDLCRKLLVKAKSDVCLLISTANAFRRLESGGFIPLINEPMMRGVTFRILIPFDERVAKAIENIPKIAGCDDNRFKVRFLEPGFQMRMSLMIVDEKFLVSVEVRDDSQQTSADAIGFSIYSNSCATVSSYVSMYRSLWKQLETQDELMKAYSKLQLSDRMQLEFLNIAAHELRSPVQPILGLSEIIKKTPGLSKEHKDLLEVIIRNAMRLNRLQEDILDVARLEGQLLRLKREKVNVFEAISDKVKDFQADLNEKGIRITLNCSHDLDIMADDQRFDQIMTNILSNAIRYTVDHGTIQVNAELRNGQIIIGVRDSGPGIDPAIEHRLFQKFATSYEKGTGLGLYISKQLVELQGGRIWAENNIGESGATFCFSLPTG